MDRTVSVNNNQNHRTFFNRINAISCIRFLVVTELSIKTIKVLFIAILLYIKRNEYSEGQLKVFLTVYATLTMFKILSFYIKNRIFFRVDRIPEFDDGSDISLINNLLEATTLFWYIIGFHWIQECNNCNINNPLIYYVSCFIVGFGFFSFVAPLIAIMLLLALVSYAKPKLSIITYHGPSDLPDNNHTCTICFDNYNDGCQVKFLPCKHHFHSDCIDEWFNIRDTCPLCKKHVNLLYDLVDATDPGV